MLGLTAVITPVPLPDNGQWDLLAMIVITVVLWLMAITHKYKITRKEGAFLLLCYLGYMTWSVLREM